MELEKSARELAVIEKNEVLRRSRIEYNKGRKIVIRNIPPVTYDEVKHFIGDHKIDKIEISKKHRHAVITLVHGHQAECILESLTGKPLLDTAVRVAVNPENTLLYVGHLPPCCSDADLARLLEPYGRYERCFLMRSEATGHSKGYGFIEFSHNRAKTAEVREKLDGLRLRDNGILHCDFIGDHLLSYDSLHSSCLLIENVPDTYSDDSLKEMVCRVAEPKHCMVLKECGAPIGLVTFDSAREAEQTWSEIDGHSVEGRHLRCTYSKPGESIEEAAVRIQRVMKNVYIINEQQSTVSMEVLQNVHSLLQSLGPPSAKGGVSHSPLLADPNMQLSLMTLLTTQHDVPQRTCQIQRQPLACNQPPYQATHTGNYVPPQHPYIMRQNNACTGYPIALVKPTAVINSREVRNEIQTAERNQFVERQPFRPLNSDPYNLRSQSKNGGPFKKADQHNTEKTPKVMRKPACIGSEVKKTKDCILVPTPCGTYKVDTSFLQDILHNSPLGRKPTASSRSSGRKRGASVLLPVPEPSPDGGYIGQHSQGIGGHYADSYFKRKKLCLDGI